VFIFQLLNQDGDRRRIADALQNLDDFPTQPQVGKGAKAEGLFNGFMAAICSGSQIN
jgi:hypothetical protein